MENNNKILLLKQTKKNGGAYSLLGGRVERGEGAIQTVIRESWEESGVVLQANDLDLVHVLNRVKNNQCRVTFFFRANKWKGEIVAKERHKFKDLEWHTMKELPEQTKIAIQMVLERYKKGLSFTEIHD